MICGRIRLFVCVSTTLKGVADLRISPVCKVGLRDLEVFEVESVRGFRDLLV